MSGVRIPLTSIVHVAIGTLPDTLVVIDATRRTYLGLSRDGSYWHAVRPARLDDPAVGDGLVRAGDLLCSCVAGRFGRRCYWTDLSIAWETGQSGAFAEPSEAEVRHERLTEGEATWFDSPAGAGESVEAFRG